MKEKREETDLDEDIEGGSKGREVAVGDDELAGVAIEAKGRRGDDRVEGEV